jgi:hypothetical protein
MAAVVKVEPGTSRRIQRMATPYHRLLLSIVAVISLTTAATAQTSQAERTHFVQDTIAKLNFAREKCMDELRSPSLDIIRDKVPFETSPLRPTPVQFLVIDRRPSANEKAALLAWATIRERCFGYGNEAVNAISFPASTDQTLSAHVRGGILAFVLQGHKSTNYLIALLYSGKLTFGEFNRQRAQINDQLYAEMRQWLLVLDSLNRAAEAERAAAVQAAAEAAVTVLRLTACVAARGHIAALCQ